MWTSAVFVLVLAAAARPGRAVTCYRSSCLDEANITACLTNRTTRLVDCAELAGYSNQSEAANATACVKYSVTGATYRRIAGENYSPCEALEVRTCLQYYSEASLDLGGRLQDALRYAGVNETVLDVRICHGDACNAARDGRPPPTTLLLASAAVMGAALCRLV